MTHFYKLVINNIHRETDKAVVISFQIPESLKQYFDYIPGQYIVIKTNLNNSEIRRSYSICDIPGDTLKIAVKATEDGFFSEYANTKLKVGDSLEVSNPQGKFNLKIDSAQKNDYIAFAAGSGITPIMGMIKSVLVQESQSRFVLVYANRTPKDVIFKVDIAELLKTYPERFFIQSIYSRANETDALFGRIDQGVVNYCVKNKFQNFTFEDYYICGPESMIDTVKSVLTQDGVTEEAIHFELFTDANVAEVEVVGVTSLVTIILDDETHQIVVKKDQSILEAALDAGLDAPYSCQGGICASCMAKIHTGSAKMVKNMILTDGEIEEGLILTCQAHPTSESMEINYDDI